MIKTVTARMAALTLMSALILEGKCSWDTASQDTKWIRGAVPIEGRGR